MKYNTFFFRHLDCAAARFARPSEIATLQSRIVRDKTSRLSMGAAGC
jgi:hypothetical protein